MTTQSISLGLRSDHASPTSPSPKVGMSFSVLGGWKGSTVSAEMWRREKAEREEVSCFCPGLLLTRHVTLLLPQFSHLWNETDDDFSGFLSG